MSEEKKQWKFWIDVPVWELHVDSYQVIASDEAEAMQKFKDGDYKERDYSECLEEHKEKPQISSKEEIR